MYLDENEKQLIELRGYTTGILSKNANHCVFYFSDYKYGQLVCVAERDCILYYEALRGKEYNLQVELKGITTRKNGKPFTHNALVIKKVRH